jgi:transmembrane sensor
LRASDVSQIEAVRFRAWLAGDPARRREFEAVDTFWEDLAAIEHSPEVEWVRARIAARQSKQKKWRGYLAMAATVLVAVGSSWSAWQYWIAGRYTTAVGEQRIVPLADEIRLRYSDGARAVELVRGQANFDVAKDPNRPFIVSAGGGEVRALGTVFDVYKVADKVTVTLIEGKVAVTPTGSAMESTRPASSDESQDGAGRNDVSELAKAVRSEIVLAAGEQLSFDTTPAVVEVPDVVKLASAEVPRVSAWRARKLYFSDTPILDAIAEANRYSREKIVLDAPELANERISGTFEAGKNEALVEGLQTYFQLNVVRVDGHRIVLTR